VPALITGVVVWFIVGMNGGGGDDNRLNADISNLLNAFSQGQGESVSLRFEGETPPGFPSDVPTYPGAEPVSGLLQIAGEDAGYLVIYDTADSRSDVADFYDDALSRDPWQTDFGRDARDQTVARFTKIDNENVAGLVLIGESKDDSRTTIVKSVQVTGGAGDLAEGAFSPGEPRTLPEGFPDTLPSFEDALLIESAYQKEPGAQSFAVSYVTTADASEVLDFYRGALEERDLTVEDGDASGSSLEDAEAIQFSDAAQEVSGTITVGKFAEDDGYTRIDKEVRVAQQ
jgi:hypothetical protein